MEIIPAPYDRCIYVGSGHSGESKCPGSGTPHYSQVRIRFETRRDGALLLTGKICPVCGAVFLPYKKLRKALVPIRRLYLYPFFRTVKYLRRKDQAQGVQA